MNYSFGRIKARSLFCYLPDSCLGPFLQNIDNFSVYLSVIMKNQTTEMYDDERWDAFFLQMCDQMDHHEPFQTKMKKKQLDLQHEN